VTGGSGGIGRSIALAFKNEGARVVVADIRPPQDEHDTEYVKTDVSDEGQVASLMQHLGPMLDVLVNNAGISCFAPLSELSTEQFDKVIAVNLKGAFLCAKHAAPLLRRAGNAAIINIVSTRALMSEPQSEAYAASKGGLLALTHALALSLGPQVRVNAISPGWINTRQEQVTRDDHLQHPAGRVGTVRDIAEACMFLADSRSSGFVCGQNIIVDGGMTKKMIYV